MNDAIPIPAPDCPLCGGPNGCAPARCGSFEVECWCTRAVIPAEVLEAVPESVRGQACVCAACAAASVKARSG